MTDKRVGHRERNVQQKELDFDRMSKLRMLERVRLPKPAPGSKTRKATMLAALRVIDSHARENRNCRLKMQTIANEMGVSKATAKRAIYELERQGLLLIRYFKTSGWRSSEYTIFWPNIYDLVPQENDHQGAKVHGEPSEGASGTDRRCTVNHPKVHGEPSSEAPCIKRQEETSQVKRGAIEVFEFEEEERWELQVKSRRLARFLRPRTVDEKDTIAKLAILWQSGEFSEHDIEVSLEAVQTNEPNKRLRYFRRCLENQLSMTPEELSAKLSTVDLPPPAVRKDHANSGV